MKYKLTFSMLPNLQRITHGARRYEAIYNGPSEPIDVWGDTKRETLPEHVMQALAERFKFIYDQEPHTRELLLLEIKPCTI